MKKQIPRWHNPVFLRMSGLLDKVLHKVSLTQREDGHRLYGGRMVWMQCRFDRYQSKVRECLLRQLEPLEKEARRLVNVLRETTVPPAPRPARTTGAVRAAAALRARRESQAAQINAACTRLAQLRDQIDRTAALADIRVDQALSQANQSLARYGKACYFQALERELPRVVRSFCAGQSVNQDLRAEMDRLLKEDRR